MKLSFLVIFSFLSQATKPEMITFPKIDSLHEAVYFEDIKKVKSLIKKGVDVNGVSGERVIQGLSVVSFSFGREQIKALNRITERRARLKNTLLIDRLKNSSSDYFSNNGTTPLHWIRNDNLEIAKLLIESGADVNAKTKKNSIHSLVKL